MHILLIHQAFVTTGDAGGTRHIELARCFAAEGHKVTIITSPVSYLTGENRKPGFYLHRDEDYSDNIRIMYSFTTSGMHKGFVRRLFSFFSFMISSLLCAISVKDVDIVWGTSPNIFQAWTAWLSARLKGVPFMLEIRDLWPEFAVAIGALNNGFLISCSLWLERFLYRHADAIVVNSPGFIPHIQKISGKTAMLAPNGSDPGMFEHADGSAFRTNNRLNDKFVVMYSGAHGPANDLGVVIQTASQMQDNPDVAFVLVGGGKDRDELIRMSRELGLKNVLFIPPVSKDKIADVLAAQDAGLAILKPLEMFKITYPNKVFDIMASGKPVLCQIDGVIRQVVEEADAGIFVAPGDPQALKQAIIDLKDSPQRCHEMGENGRRAVKEKYTREISAAIIEDIMLSLISNR